MEEEGEREMEEVREGGMKEERERGMEGIGGGHVGEETHKEFSAMLTGDWLCDSGKPCILRATWQDTGATQSPAAAAAAAGTQPMSACHPAHESPGAVNLPPCHTRYCEPSPPLLSSGPRPPCLCISPPLPCGPLPPTDRDVAVRADAVHPVVLDGSLAGQQLLHRLLSEGPHKVVDAQRRGEGALRGGYWGEERGQRDRGGEEDGERRRGVGRRGEGEGTGRQSPTPTNTLSAHHRNQV